MVGKVTTKAAAPAKAAAAPAKVRADVAPRAA